jgi:hypothetical protein
MQLASSGQSRRHKVKSKSSGSFPSNRSLTSDHRMWPADLLWISTFIQNLWWIPHAAWFSQEKLRIPHSRHWQTPARPSILKRISATKTPVPLFRVPQSLDVQESWGRSWGSRSPSLGSWDPIKHDKTFLKSWNHWRLRVKSPTCRHTWAKRGDCANSEVMHELTGA